MPEELRTEICNTVQEAVNKTIPKKKKYNKEKWLSEEALQIADKRREAKSKEKERYIHLNAEFQRIARSDKKAFLSDHCKETEENILECKVKWTLGSITRNEASGNDGIPAELIQILKDDAVKLLKSICQQIWKTQQWPQDWKRSIV